MAFTVDGNTYPAGDTASIPNVGDITIMKMVALPSHLLKALMGSTAYRVHHH